MKFKSINVEYATEFLTLDPSSPSGLRWRKRTHRGRMKPGEVVGTRRLNGYWATTLQSEPTYCHRIVWALHHGEDPGQVSIDHKDRNQNNNAIENLRAVGVLDDRDAAADLRDRLKRELASTALQS